MQLCLATETILPRIIIAKTFLNTINAAKRVFQKFPIAEFRMKRKVILFQWATLR